MAKKTPDEELPTSDAPAETTAEATDGTLGEDKSLPQFLVSSQGLDSLSVHAVDEPDAIRQFYKHHKVVDIDKRNHKAVRVS